jgi:Winged helix DNA-binding domain
MDAVETLRRETLRRQFPILPRADWANLVRLFDLIGPVQSQAPRAPFLAAGARLPGVTVGTVTDAFEQHQLVLGSNLRGTVHASTAGQFRLVQAVSEPLRAAELHRSLGLQAVAPTDVVAEIERAAADGWRDRDYLVGHVGRWLDRVDPDPHRPAPTTYSQNLVWGHPGLLRRPLNQEWHRRGATVHRLATGVLPAEVAPAQAEAQRALVRLHLAAYGPATRRDIAWWLGEKLTPIDEAVRQLGDELVSRPGAGRDPLLDLTGPPPGGNPEPGVRLLPEFDGLLLGFAPENRDRFLRPEHLPLVWNRANGSFSPIVLVDDHLAATWRLANQRGRTTLEVTALPGEALVDADRFTGPAAAVTAALGQPIDDLEVHPAA